MNCKMAESRGGEDKEKAAELSAVGLLFGKSNIDTAEKGRTETR